jgi:SSS family solute:Na+ symporter
VPKNPLQILDWLVIGSYFFVLMAIALYYRRFAGRNLDEFFLGGRRNSGWSNGLAYAAALMNADVAPAYSGFAVATGVFVCWFYLSRFGIALFFGAILFAVFWRRLNLFTTPEFYELRFGGVASSVIRTWVALKSSLIAMVAWTGTGLLAMHKIGGPVLGFDKTTVILIVVPIVLAYVLLSGFAGVVATSSVQTLIMLIGSAMLAGIVLWQSGGPAVFATKLLAAGGPGALDAVPPLEHGVLPLAAVLAWMIGTSLGYGGDTAPLGGAMEGQYVLSSKNAREASKMYVVAEVALFLLLLLVTLPSLAAVFEWPALRLPASDPQHVDREMAYGLLMSKYLPPGMLGLLFVVMLSAVMSTIGSNLTFGAQVLVNDVYRRYLAPHETERHYLWIGRAAAALILILAIIVAYRVELIFDVAAFMVAASAAEMPANWAQWWWWRFNSWGRLSASFGGLIIPAVVWFVPPTSHWPWWDRTYLVIGLNSSLSLLVTLLTPPDRLPILGRFYQAAQPLGAWGIVRKQISNQTDPHQNNAPEDSGFGLILQGIALALLGAVSVMLMVVGLSFLYVGRYGSGLGLLAGFALGTIIFFRLYGPYLSFLEQRAPPRSPSPAPVLPAEAHTLPDQSEPVSTNFIVAMATGGYGLLIGGGGLIWTRGEHLLLNLMAGLAFLVAAGIVWLLGRPTRSQS